MARKFFVVVFASTRRALLNLSNYHLDLFQATAQTAQNQEFTIEGLLSLEEVERLVNDGYRVLIQEEASKRARATQEVTSFQEWMQAMGEPTGEDATLRTLEISAAPPNGYLRTEGIEATLQRLAIAYPSICQVIQLPEKTWEQRTSRAIRIGQNSGRERSGILLLGGVHARELVNPDLLISFALKLCQAYQAGTGLTFGNKSYDATTIQQIVNQVDLFIFPLVNPDGRAFVQSATGDPMWRKNRNPNRGQSCKGVDLNRNFDFLWSSGIGTSSSSCSEIYRGRKAFSEPETRNVRYLLDTYKNITTMLDIHSYSKLVMYPWGDDEDQTTNATMNFHNPAYNGLRGTLGDTAYKEYLTREDLNWFTTTCNRVRDGIRSVRGTVYTVQQSIGLYPTTATSDDYAYSRCFVDHSKRRVLACAIETGSEFQPPYAEALNIIAEVSAGLIEFCAASMTLTESAQEVALIST
ncbi:M14 family zinc carboxypeptidase [Leptolyngbya ohadii]|uniref:M14 family zinc carboxypeptidase n=1 Tax=Leptolyngbya ohadii TaxID=1962290 RepID=UPI000B59973A|nr:M14 family zinc carboxypeptidase [Leptolyngbya ohadii]